MMFTPEGLAKFFMHEIGEHRVHEAELLALEVIGQMVEAEAKGAIGKYEYDWPQLADSTQSDRERKGYAPNEPLLRTGELRNAIEHQVLAEEMAVEIGVPAGMAHSGSGADVGEIAEWQEFGTATIPPRPFLGPSLYYLLGNGAIQEVIKQAVGSAIMANHFDHTMLELIKEVAKSLYHIARIPLDAAEENDQENGRRR